VKFCDAPATAGRGARVFDPTSESSMSTPSETHQLKFMPLPKLLQGSSKKVRFVVSPCAAQSPRAALHGWIQSQLVAARSLHTRPGSTAFAERRSVERQQTATTRRFLALLLDPKATSRLCFFSDDAGRIAAVVAAVPAEKKGGYLIPKPVFRVDRFYRLDQLADAIGLVS
jgi:hypothetical protein